MMKQYKLWLLGAVFVLLGTFSVQAQDQTPTGFDPLECMNLDLQHVESDFVPAAECNYYRHFFTLENHTSEEGLSTLSIAAGFNRFILYRYSTIFGEKAIPTPVAELTFTLADGSADYEITYLNQDPRPGYDLELVTQGTVAIEDYMLNLDGIVLVDQCKVVFADNGEFEDFYYEDGENVDYSALYYWSSISYVMVLADEDMGSNSVEVPFAPGINLFSMGNYTYDELEQDMYQPTLQAGMKNAYFECFSLGEEPEITGYTILRGDNTYPTDTISYLVRPGTDRLYVEQCEALPEYFGQEETWEIARNDTSMMVLGDYGDYMTYVPVVRTNGADRVKQDGENTYGGFLCKTGVAGMSVDVDGIVHDQDSEEPLMFKDDDGVDCAVFENHFELSITLPDYATWEYKPQWLTIWVKSDNIRNFYFDDDGNPVYAPKDEDDQSGDYLEVWYEYLDDEYWDEDLQEYVSSFTGELTIGDYEFDRCGFGATYDATLEEGVTFVVRFYYEVQPNMPLKGRNPSWMPSFCIVEQEVPWKITSIATGLNEVNSEQEVGKTFYNVQGIASDKPFSGFNIVVTRYSDGSTKTKKVIL